MSLVWGAGPVMRNDFSATQADAERKGGRAHNSTLTTKRDRNHSLSTTPGIYPRVWVAWNGRSSRPRTHGGNHVNQ